MHKTISFKMVVLVAGVLALGAVGLGWRFKQIYDRNADRITRESIRSAASTFAQVQRSSTDLMAAVLEALQRDPELRAGLAARDAARLLVSSDPLFREYRSRFGITHWNYWEPEQAGDANPRGLRNVLRVATPAMRGDHVERETLARVARLRTTVSGLDLGYTGMVLRVLSPVQDGARPVGYVELGKEIGDFLSAVKKVSGDDYGLLLSKARLDEKKWTTQRAAAGLKNNWADLPEVVLAQNTSDDEGVLQFHGRIQDLPDEGLPLELVTRAGRVLARGVFPVHDVSGAKVGAVFVLRDITAIYEEARAGQGQALLGVALLMALLAVVITFAFQRLVVRRLRRMTRVATRVVGGEFDLEIVPSAEDEIGAFETLFEQFRLLFVELIGQAQQRNAGRR